MPLEKTYNPEALEAKWYAHWEKAGAFRCGQKPVGEPYTIVIPPPNVTGSLHIGHALDNTLQDILVRFERLRGKDVLWQPGVDHAGIATQMVVERQLDEEGINRRDLGREKFLDRVWKWKEESGGRIIGQLKRLGASCDWSRERFTMDEGYKKAVLKKFIDLYNDGLIYRDKRLVNWDPKLLTAISDLEVEQKEVDGQFWHLKYPLADDPKTFIIVATTRPETMLGDTAVAVHPEDPRYKKLVGKMIAHPLTGRKIPIIADEWADPEQGSGAVKITPAHDFNDFDVGKRHDLEMINVLDAHGKINENAPKAYQGMDRFDARKKIVKALEDEGLLAKVEPRKFMAPFGDRSGVLIEPWLTDQWYVDAETLAKPAIEAVEKGRTRFVPKNWEKTYFEWMRNIQPWCISRQLWWGHRIPAWYAEDGTLFVAESEEEALKKGKEKLGDDVKLTRDEDVLDTWFSSAMWPFATLGWPEKTDALKRFYPTSTLVTGFDIIFFWVARMMMDGLHFMKEVPFDTVYVHALVRDEAGQKMSKSKGNVVDPLEFIEKYGADAIRFTLAALESQGRDIKFAESRVEGYRNFATKLWNAARFAEMNDCVNAEGFDPEKVKHPLNAWIVGETKRAGLRETRSLEAYRFNDASGAIYHFTWHTFCDWYLELIKPVMDGKDEAAKEETRKTCAWVLDRILVLLHPFMPFITEELWHAFGVKRDTDLIMADWPDWKDLPEYKEAGDDINWLIEVVTAIRSSRQEVNVPAGARVLALVKDAGEGTKTRLEAYRPLIERLARVKGLETKDHSGKKAIQVVVDEATFILPLEGVIDIGAEQARLEKNIAKAEKEIKALEGRLKNKGFTANAPDHVIEEAQARLDDKLAQKEKLEEALARLS